MPKRKAKTTITVELTKMDLGVLRRLISEEARRLNYNSYQRRSDEPSKLRRLRPVANKLWEAREKLVEQ